MKALAIIFGLMVFGSFANANQSVFNYKTLLIGQSQPGILCPEVVNVTAINEENSLRGKSVFISTSKGVQNGYGYEATTKTCTSGVMLCYSENHYVNQHLMSDVLLRLNNDGAYPTTDLPGYSVMTLTYDRGADTERICTYMLE